MDWSLLDCGRTGHLTFAPEEPLLRDQLSAQTATGEAWRCLRCAAFVPGPPQRTGPARDAPAVRRGNEVRSALILRVFALERFIRAIAFAGISYGLWRFRGARQSIEATFDRELPIVRELFSQLGVSIDHSKIVGLVQHALTVSSQTITLLALGLAGYAVVEIIEGLGLWLTRRWGEYFAMIATSAGLPLEIYDLTKKVTVTTLIFLAVNLALVAYLVAAKRLFGVRGGKHAYEARLRSESVMEAAAAAAAAAAAPAPAAAGPLGETAPAEVTPSGPARRDPARSATGRSDTAPGETAVPGETADADGTAGPSGTAAGPDVPRPATT